MGVDRFLPVLDVDNTATEAFKRWRAFSRPAALTIFFAGATPEVEEPVVPVIIRPLRPLM